MIQRMRAPIRRFVRADDGSYSIETLLMFPLLLWALLACFSFFDGIRQENVNLRAAHTLGDLLSRETKMVDADYMEGMYKVLDFLVYTRGKTEMRVSVATYDGDDELFRLDWSYAEGEVAALTQTTLQNVAGRIPTTAGGDTVILVETWTDYVAPFVMGLRDREIRNFVVTRPRFAPQLKWDDGSGGAGA